MIRTCASLGSGILLAATPVKVAEPKEVQPDPLKSIYMRKPSDLPIYKPLHEIDQ